MCNFYWVFLLNSHNLFTINSVKWNRFATLLFVYCIFFLFFFSMLWANLSLDQVRVLRLQRQHFIVLLLAWANVFMNLFFYTHLKHFTKLISFFFALVAIFDHFFFTWNVCGKIYVFPLKKRTKQMTLGFL